MSVIKWYTGLLFWAIGLFMAVFSHPYIAWILYSLSIGYIGQQFIDNYQRYQRAAYHE